MTTVRAMKKSDITDVQKVAVTSWHDTYDGIIPENIRKKFLERAYHPDFLEKKMTSTHMYVAVDKGEIVGFAQYMPVSKDGVSTLAAIYLLPISQGTGIGSALLEKGVKELKGLSTLYVEVEQKNTPAKAFYERKGFKKVDAYTDVFAGHELITEKWRKDLSK